MLEKINPKSLECVNCGSNKIKEIGNNHRQTTDEMEYLEYYKCSECGYEFVE